ncbi:uncharacterized protein CIMG_09500 [Coccidioides immitis RS]|uniref:Uncharacterized protein n=1 Tax=Coccidioides immitis (strain RS) TaxID=246410 RepID=A0A0E1RW15_COCIM|nr:uncharacterized protein CIMG_09500 [Coccidioides immitis RS]EAS28296.2 hypothetical protein CIMG_09500 [Coccidioides immitis RS]
MNLLAVLIHILALEEASEHRPLDRLATPNPFTGGTRVGPLCGVAGQEGTPMIEAPRKIPWSGRGHTQLLNPTILQVNTVTPDGETVSASSTSFIFFEAVLQHVRGVVGGYEGHKHFEASRMQKLSWKAW